MSKTRDQIVEERRLLKAHYRDLYEKLSKLLFHHDPLSINYNTNTDEYEPEVGTILPRLKECHSEEDVLNIVHEEFVHWFGAENIGPKEGYAKITSEVWQLWKTSNSPR